MHPQRLQDQVHKIEVARGLGVGGCSDRAPLPEVRVALVRDVSTLPVRLAQDLGYAEQEGIRLAISETPSVSKGMEALIGRSVDVAAGGLSQAIQVRAEGRPVRCLQGLGLGISDKNGIIRIHLPAAYSAGDELVLKLSDSKTPFLLISPWDGRVLVPAMDVGATSRHR